MSASRFIRPDDPAWAKALASCKHDLYHLPAYAEVEGNWIGAEPIAFLYECDGQTMMLPLLERPTPAGVGTDAVTPYGYSPPVFSSSATEDFIAGALLSFQDTARDRGMVSTFIRLHPLLCSSLPSAQSNSELQWTEVERGSTVALPLEDEPEQWLKQVTKGHRLDIRKLERSGCKVVVNSDAAWAAFPGIYRATMERIGASPSYFYSDEYLREFRSRLGPRVHCAAVFDCEHEPLCASLFTNVGGLLQYHLSGTRANAARQAPTKLLLAHMRQWARENGVRYFHLGGGYGGGEDTLFQFKRRFGGAPLPFRTVSIVHDQEKFDAECAVWRSKTDEPLAGPAGFFPPYRAPVIANVEK